MSVRERWHFRRSWARLLVEPVELVRFVMSRKMLRGIRDHAQSGPGERQRRPEGQASPRDGRSRDAKAHPAIGAAQAVGVRRRPT